jgi:hypothetical protein
MLLGPFNSGVNFDTIVFLRKMFAENGDAYQMQMGNAFTHRFVVIGALAVCGKSNQTSSE